MGRRSKTQQLIDSTLGQHLALSVAAHLARSQLVPDPLLVYDAQHMSETLDIIGNAMTRVAPLYIQDPKSAGPRELTSAEIEGATVRRGATMLVLKDGRTLSSVSMKRADLRQAIAILKTVGIPELRVPAPKPASAPEPKPDLLSDVGELEALLRSPLLQPHVQKANAIAVGIARHARHGYIANLSMQLVSAVQEAVHDGEAEPRRVGVALARLRAAVEDEENPPGAENSKS